MDKQVESCEMRLKSGGTTVIFEIKFTNSSVKKHFLPIIETEAIEVNICSLLCHLIVSYVFITFCF